MGPYHTRLASPPRSPILAAMAGKTRSPKVQARRATSLALSQDDAKAVLERVNTARMRLHDRLATLRIFGTPAQGNVTVPALPSPVQGGDHPLVQILLAMRDHVLYIDAQPALAPAEHVAAKGRVLEAMARTTQAIVTEAGKASTEVRDMAEAMMNMEQRVREHKDKMEILRAKSPLALGGTRSTADLLRDLGPEPIVVLDDDAEDIPSTTAGVAREAGRD